MDKRRLKELTDQLNDFKDRYQSEIDSEKRHKLRVKGMLIIEDINSDGVLIDEFEAEDLFPL